MFALLCPQAHIISEAASCAKHTSFARQGKHRSKKALAFASAFLLVEAGGVDLPCGAGRVAALACRRHAIHSRSRSTPTLIQMKSPARMGGAFPLVEAGGVEPPSENASEGTSPCAVGCSGLRRFPFRQASQHAWGSGSFMMHGARKA